MDFRETHIRLQNKLEDIRGVQREQLEVAEDFRDGQTSMGMQLEGITQGLQNSITEGSYTRSAIDVVAKNLDLNSQKLDNAISSLNQLRLAEGHMDTKGTSQAHYTELLSRIVRAELRDLIIPRIEQEFRTYNSNTDRKLEQARQSIDILSTEVGKTLNTAQEKPRSAIQERDVGQSANTQMPSKEELEDESSVLKEKFEAAPVCRTKKRVDIQRYCWRFTLPIGHIWITIMISSKAKSEKGRQAAEAYKTHTHFFSRRYQCSITFVPIQKLLKLKGLEMRYKVKQDHLSTYLELCPAITFFNVISPDANVFYYIREDDVDGLQKDFSRRQASPNDRNPNGVTLLHVS